VAEKQVNCYTNPKNPFKFLGKIALKKFVDHEINCFLENPMLKFMARSRFDWVYKVSFQRHCSKKKQS
jgi:hypothetical protein